MAKSLRLTLAQVRAAGRVIDECRELGDNLSLWRAHLLARKGHEVALADRRVRVDRIDVEQRYRLNVV